MAADDFTRLQDVRGAKAKRKAQRQRKARRLEQKAARRATVKA